MVELLASVSVAAVAVTFLLGGLRSLSAMTETQHATAVIRTAVGTARRLAYLGSETASITAGRTGLSVTVHEGAQSVGTFALPTGFFISRATRGGVIRFFADGLSDNASIAVTHEASGETSTIFVDSRGEIR